jgi:aspartyl aminopeptidase
LALFQCQAEDECNPQIIAFHCLLACLLFPTLYVKGVPVNFESTQTAQDLVAFLEKSPSPFHCVQEAKERLIAKGFIALEETDSWNCEAGKGYVVTRGGSSLVAFRLGQRSPSDAGFRIIGAHTDSPNLRLKPRFAKTKEGILQFDVDVYGGVLLATWGDRDLGLAGRVVIHEENNFRSLLLRIDRPVCRVANLAIHLNREVNEKGLYLNKHQHLAPIAAHWNSPGSPADAVRMWVGESLQINPEQIVGHDLSLFDIQKPTLGGQRDEFIFSARLDNQAMCYSAVASLLQSESSQEKTAVIALFDHEEVGSVSTRGADGPFLDEVLSRLSGNIEQRSKAYARSFMISADMAHAVHPNYSDLHDANHMPRLNAGPVLKTNYNQRYASDGESSALFRYLCQKNSIPCQEFVNRPDLACGSTIGPISAAKLGIRTVDVGNPMLSMHSIREMAGSSDPAFMATVQASFLRGE